MAQKIDSEVLLPRRPGDASRNENKRIDMQLQRQQNGGYFKIFGDEIPSRATTTTKRNPDITTTKPASYTESTAPSSPEDSVTTHESGAYPVISV